MRPIANFALHAFAAAAVTAFAATSAAAQYLVLGDSVPGASSRDRGKHIDVLSYSFGVSETRAEGKVEHEWKVEEGESAPPPAGGVRVAVGDVDGDGRAAKAPRTTTKMLAPGATKPSSGLATGKRQHRPITITKEWDASTPQLAQKRQHGWVTVSKPVDGGSLMFRGSLPGCTVGAAYPDAMLQTADARYELKDVEISGCGGDSVTLNYAKVRVRGWDPQKKEAN